MVSITSAKLTVDKTSVEVGQPITAQVDFTLSERVKSATIDVSIVDVTPGSQLGELARQSVTIADSSSGRAVIPFTINKPGTYTVKAYVNLTSVTPYYLFEVLVSVSGNVENTIVVVDSAKSRMYAFSPQCFYQDVPCFSERLYTEVWYSIKAFTSTTATVCSTISMYSNDNIVGTTRLCASPGTSRTYLLSPSKLSAGTLRIVATPESQDVIGADKVYTVIDLASINTTISQETNIVGDVKYEDVVATITGLTPLQAPFSYGIRMLDGNVVTGFTTITGDSSIRLRAPEPTGQASTSVCVDTIEIRLCNDNWSAKCKPVLITIPLSQRYCAKASHVPYASLTGTITGADYTCFKTTTGEIKCWIKSIMTHITGVVAWTSVRVGVKEHTGTPPAPGSTLGVNVCTSNYYKPQLVGSPIMKLNIDEDRTFTDGLTLSASQLSSTYIILCYDDVDGTTRVMDVKRLDELVPVGT
jgi:hypothetical protein